MSQPRTAGPTGSEGSEPPGLGDAAEERLRALLLRLPEDLARRTLLVDDALVEEADLGRHLPAKPISWVAMTIVMPSLASWRTMFSTSATSSGSRAEVISSRRSSWGSMASARTMATRCCWPPESRSGYSLRLVLQADAARAAAMARSSAMPGVRPSTFVGARVTLRARSCAGTG